MAWIVVRGRAGGQCHGLGPLRAPGRERQPWLPFHPARYPWISAVGVAARAAAIALLVALLGMGGGRRRAVAATIAAAVAGAIAGMGVGLAFAAAMRTPAAAAAGLARRALAARLLGLARRAVAPADRHLRLEPGQVADLHVAAEQAHDLAQQLGVVLRDQRQRLAVGAVAAGAADPVHVVLGDHRQDRKSTRLNSSHVKISYA